MFFFFFLVSLKFLLAGTFQLFDVIPNAQTLANMRGSEPVPVWVWCHFGWVGVGRVQPYVHIQRLGFLIVVRPCGARRIGITVFLFLFAALLSPGRSVV